MHFPPHLRSVTGIALAAVALFSSSAAAQDCRLVIRAGKTVLMPGQSTPVDVYAQFPLTAYAFAASQFRVLADIPAWLFASAGVIAGSDVLNINVSQSHQPQLGAPADPTRPLRIWTGTFQPTSWVPQLVELRTSPLSFSFFPSKLTPSSAPCVADPSRDFVMVNPMSVRAMRVAPGAGTTVVRTGPDSIRAENPSAALLIGQLLPAIQKVREAASTRVGPSAGLNRLKMTVVPQRDIVPTDTLSLNFGKIEFEPTSGCQVSMPGSIRYEFHAMHRGGHVRVFSGQTGLLPFPLPELPSVFSARVERRLRLGEQSVVATAKFEAEQLFSVPGLPPFLCDAIEVHAVQNNLKQIGIAMHVFEAEGAGALNFVFSDGSVRF